MSFADATLVTDADLSRWESKMPALAITLNVFTGKRLLAKNFLAKQLLKRGINPDDLTDPMQLTDAACFKELELCFRDLSDKQDSIAGEKARYYAQLFDDELELLLLRIGTSDAPVTASLTSIPLYRA